MHGGRISSASSRPRVEGGRWTRRETEREKKEGYGTPEQDQVVRCTGKRELCKRRQKESISNLTESYNPGGWLQL